MPVTVGVTAYTGHDQPVAKCDAVFQDLEWELLVRFASFEQELATTTFVQAGMPHNVSFALSASGQSRLPELPPDVQISEFLHKMRPFILEQEPTFYMRVQSVIGKAVAIPPIRHRLGFFNDFWTGKVSTDFVRFSVDELTINSQEALDLWLNAFEYHRDRLKQERLEKATAVIPFPIAKAMFIDLIVLKAEAVQGLAALIRDMVAAVERRRGWVG